MPQLTKLLETRHGQMLAFPGDTFITRCLEVYGEFSPGEWRLLEQVIKPGMTIVEIGANIGAHTLSLARACRPGRLYAFEPQPRVFQVLCANLALNDIDNVTALPDACGSAPGHAVIPNIDYAQAGNFGGVSLRDADGEGVKVRIVRLDDLELAACHLIKIDVEGFEAEALRGAAETIARCRPILYVENDRLPKHAELVGLIDEMSYRLYWHTPPLVEPENFRGVAENVFDKRYVSFNMICLPQERQTQTDLEPVQIGGPHLLERAR